MPFSQASSQRPIADSIKASVVISETGAVSTDATTSAASSKLASVFSSMVSLVGSRAATVELPGCSV